jgi:hypothetical protein
MQMRTRTLVRTQRRNRSRRVPAIVAGSVLAVALVAAGSASALSTRWTLRNVTTSVLDSSFYGLRAIEVAPVDGWKFGIEGLPDGCRQGVGTKIHCNLLPAKKHQSWELERPYYAMDVTYRVTGFLIEPHEDVRVEYRIKNWLLAQRVECRFHLPDRHWTHWAEKQHVQFAHTPRDDDAQSYRTELVCEGSHRHVGFSEDSTFAAL